MGGDDKDLHFDKASVQKITQGLRSALGELGKVGDSTGAATGAGFAHLAMAGMEAGQHDLAEDFEDFCERWDWGVRALIHDASEIAERLGLAAGTQWAQDQYLEGALKVFVNSVAGGSPHASEEEIERQSWGDVFTPDALHPDYSLKSWENASAEIGQTWKDTGRSLMTEGQGAQRSWLLRQALGIDDDTWNDTLDDAFGPSPEERAREQGHEQDGGS